MTTQTMGHELQRAQILAMRVAAGTTIACRSGLVWITQSGQRDDYWLPAGESLELRRGGQVVVEAAQYSRIALTRSPPRPLIQAAAGRFADAAKRWRQKVFGLARPIAAESRCGR